MQGVAVDPLFKIIASASSDSTIRVYKNRKLKNAVQFYPKNVRNSALNKFRLFLSDLKNLHKKLLS